MSFSVGTDVAIVGGGLGGSLIAAMLAKAGIPHLLIDPRTEYPDEFRCEKFDAQQIELLRETGVAKPVFEAVTPVENVWVSRFGKLIRKQQYPHFGFTYATAVNALRRKAVDPKAFLKGSVVEVKTSATRQLLSLSDGTEVEAKVVILATGANQGLQEKLGFERELINARHCYAIGFDVVPKDASGFDFDTMTYWPECQSGKMSYLTLFKAGTGFRANLFGYWQKDEADFLKLKKSPLEFFDSLMPNLNRISGGFEISGNFRVRPIDLYQWDALGVDGVVAVGDAWSSSCPGAGTGTTKVINDALCLCNDHLPNWLVQGEFTGTKIAGFYDDPRKTEIDAASLNRAYKLRSLTIGDGIFWSFQRWIRFFYHAGLGLLRMENIRKKSLST